MPIMMVCLIWVNGNSSVLMLKLVSKRSMAELTLWLKLNLKLDGNATMSAQKEVLLSLNSGLAWVWDLNGKLSIILVELVVNSWDFGLKNTTYSLDLPTMSERNTDNKVKKKKKIRLRIKPVFNGDLTYSTKLMPTKTVNSTSTNGNLSTNLWK